MFHDQIAVCMDGECLPGDGCRKKASSLPPRAWELQGGGEQPRALWNAGSHPEPSAQVSELGQEGRPLCVPAVYLASDEPPPGRLPEDQNLAVGLLHVTRIGGLGRS